MSDVPFTEEELHNLYLWVDSIPISRPKKNIARDFSDGCCVAEILHHFFPKMVELHNYVPAMSKANKITNWKTLNARVLSKLYFTVPSDEIEDLVAAVPGAIERFLRALRTKIKYIEANQLALRSMSQNQIQTPRTGSKSNPALLSVSPNPHVDTHSSSMRSIASKKQRSALSSHLDAETGVDRGEYQKEMLREQTRTIAELKETVSILMEKVMKLEELNHIKDKQIEQYKAKFGKISA